MLTRRDFSLILLTALTTGTLVAFAQSNQKTPVMPSAAIDWNSIEAKPSTTGSSKKFFEGPTPTLDLLECHASTLNPHTQNHDIVKRSNDEVIVIKEGTIEAYVGDKWVKIGPGSVIFNAANTDQAMRNPGDTPAIYHVISIHPPQATPAPKPAN